MTEVRKEKIVFLDRDGVLNVRSDKKDDPKYYVKRWEDFEWIPGSKEAVKNLVMEGYFVAIVSNQGGISIGVARDYDVDLVFTKICRTIVTEVYGDPLKAPVKGIITYMYCPHTSQDGCECRKPKPGLITTLAVKERLSLKRAWMVGDRPSDIKAGWRAGIRKLIQVNSLEDQGSDLYFYNDAARLFDRRRAGGLRIPNLANAVEFILRYDQWEDTQRR